ncbi:hypothetical protein EJ02DRAFT_335075 [Clathrospora elynae]|uniref:Heterokaryon incompatibility domain-containing protein n=1 Tax=Clathrospora elynae TaxID=706981 RepID=A0A6A5T3X9_9PLEO|nr:hypothetical protein EJ02DRAFT_335075 [Clathrospora elynae]
MVEPCIVETAWTNAENDIVHIYDEEIWDHTHSYLPLTSRAWVVQETLLAPRVLYLYGKQVFWECYDLTACEAYPEGTPIGPWRRPHCVTRSKRFQAFGKAENDRNEHSRIALERLWAGTVDMYTTCNLMYASDKLVALSGIAKLMEQTLRDKYCAGFWKSRLTTELGWSVIGSTPFSRRVKINSTTYRAPIWS